MGDETIEVLGCVAEYADGIYQARTSPAAAAREATRRLRAIQRTCARAAAREEA